MKNNKKIIIILSTLLVLISFFTILFVFNKNKVSIEKTQNSTTKEVVETTEKVSETENTTVTEETEATTEETKEVETTKTIDYSSSDNSYNNTTKAQTNKEQTTKVVNSIEETVDPSVYDKNKFPVGYTVTFNPHGTDLDGAYWVSGNCTFIWRGDRIENFDGEEFKVEGEWFPGTVRVGNCFNEANKEIFINKMMEQKPSWKGEREGQEYKQTIWVWLP